MILCSTLSLGSTAINHQLMHLEVGKDMTKSSKATVLPFYLLRVLHAHSDSAEYDYFLSCITVYPSQHSIRHSPCGYVTISKAWHPLPHWWYNHSIEFASTLVSIWTKHWESAIKWDIYSKGNDTERVSWAKGLSIRNNY